MSYLNIVLNMYITLFPAIVAGVLNSLFCKSKLLSKLKVPIDFGKCFVDKKRIFGDNKTWKGLLGYILLNCIIQVIWGMICSLCNLNSRNFFYTNNHNTILFNILIGFLLGLFYALFELPNSFIKRRIGIEPGKPPIGFLKVFFIFLDQADSVFGMCLVVAMFYKMSLCFYLVYVLIGALTHIVFNMLLYFLKVRKNMF